MIHRTLARDDNSKQIARPAHLAARVLTCWLLAAHRALGDFLLRFSCRRGTGHRGGVQPEFLAQLRVELGGDVLVVLQELAGVLATLADALALVAEPRARLLDHLVRHR